MKQYLSIILLLFAAVSFVACDKFVTFNSVDDVQVCLSNPTYQVKENKGLFVIPVTLVGESDGIVEFDVEVTSDSPDCKEDVHYMVTSKHLTIPAGKKTVNVEIKAIDDRVINADRSFTLTITKAFGAKVGNLNKAKVILVDNDDIPYERLAGTWIVTGYYAISETEKDSTVFETTIQAYDDDEDGYGTEYTITPWLVDGVMQPMNFSYKASSETATVSLPLGVKMAEHLNFGVDDVKNDFTDAYVMAVSYASSIIRSGQIVGTVSSDYSTIVFDRPFMGLICNDLGQILQVSQNGQLYFSPFFSFDSIKMTIKNK